MTKFRWEANNNSLNPDAFLITPVIKKKSSSLKQSHLHDEAKQLLHTMGTNLVGDMLHYMTLTNHATFISHAIIDTIKQTIEPYKQQQNHVIIMVNSDISGVQQRNLEEALQCPIYTRTAIILDIFSKRARSEEGKLQVKLAQYRYEQTRLAGKWDHLERQRGGTSSTGGPGEKQLEIDRRLLQKSIKKLEERVDNVQKKRLLHRTRRDKLPLPVIALVGYSNVGKSTLFNHLTNANAYADNLLFATLDTHMRHCYLPSGRKVILADTVGFITDLPPMLIDAFRATLEELHAACLIMHLSDVSSESFYNDAKEVEHILESLNLAKTQEKLNIGTKLDTIYNPYYLNACDIAISTLEQTHIDDLLRLIDKRLDIIDNVQHIEVTIPITDGKLITYCYDNGHVLSCQYDNDSAYIHVKIAPRNMAALRHLNYVTLH